MEQRQTAYYRIERGRCRPRPDSCLAAGSVVRKDTGEAVSRLHARGSTAEEALANVEALLVRELESLAPPADWGRDGTVPSLIREYVNAKERVLDEAWRPKEIGENGEAWGTECQEKFEKLEKLRIADFTKRVAQLTEFQRLDLVTPTLRELADPMDPWILDETSARHGLYRLLDKPGPLLEAAINACGWRMTRQ